MKKGKNNSSILIVGIVVVTGAVAAFIYAGRKNRATVGPDDPNQEATPSHLIGGAAPPSGAVTAANSDTKTPGSPDTSTRQSSRPGANLADKMKDTVKSLTTARPRLPDIISAAKTWIPCDVHQDWIGKVAPDFTVQDINGQQHRLRDYRGKDVIISLFSPSFSPSLPELNKLAQLQGVVGKDQLVVLGVSFAAEGAIRRYAEGQPAINYPIVAGANQDIPAPYSQGKPIPCAMFISSDGVLKLSTRGTLTPEDAKLILAAR